MGRKFKKAKEQVFQNLEVGEMVAEGKTIAKVGDKVVFIEGAVPGDVIDAKLTADKKSYFEATPIHFHHYSDLRVKPFCSHFGLCGGCKWQNLAYETQLHYKQKQVKDALERIGKAELPEINPILKAPQTSFYRNKLEYTFSNRRWLTEAEIGEGQELQRQALGFHIPKRFDKILDIQQCYLQPEPSNSIRLKVKDYAVANNLVFNDLIKLNGFLRNLIIRTAGTGQIMVIVQVYYFDEIELPKLLDFIQEEFPEITSLNYVVNSKGNETFHDLEVICWKGQPYIEEEMEGLIFRVGPKSFYQTNGAQAYALYKVVERMANLSGNELVYDLYTGTGTIANFMARKAKFVVGVEYVEMAVTDARINSELNHLRNTAFFAGDMRLVLSAEFIAQNGKPDLIITDPPRAGMHPDVIKVLLDIAPERIIYVSCNPGTQARDLAMLQPHYRVLEVQPVDMFPQTHHVENVLLLERV